MELWNPKLRYLVDESTKLAKKYAKIQATKDAEIQVTKKAEIVSMGNLCK